MNHFEFEPNTGVVIELNPNQSPDVVTIKGISGIRRVELSTQGITDKVTINFASCVINVTHLNELVKVFADVSGVSIKEAASMLNVAVTLDVSELFSLSFTGSPMVPAIATEFFSNVGIYDNLLGALKIYTETIINGGK